ncbi:hypothetical protein DRJ17_00505 [Candidatus Woesearchaeota archaeon]|nr:MAG: hypothetical protein DRJ17_00505 [Candidatus Woesearchaeota archaeon]
MAHTKPIPKVKLFIGIMYVNETFFNKAVEILKQSFGEVEDISESYNFNQFTDYYNNEMGDGQVKRFIVFRDLIDRDELANIKHLTNKIEDDFAVNGKRLINLDPGYLTEHNVVLASAKEQPHKVSIGMGMFGDVVLVYRSGNYRSYFKTFADYKTEFVQKYLLSVRKKYLLQRRSENV